MKSKVIFSFSGWDVTLRELILAPTILGLMIIFGVLIAEKIDQHVQEKNLKYVSAPHVETVEDFKDRLYTDKRFIFASGTLSTVDTVSFNDISKRLFVSPSNSDLPSGLYMYVEIEREHYTKHTRKVTDDEGHTKTQVYYTWDHEETVRQWANECIFNTVIFPLEKFDIRRGSTYIKTKEVFNDRFIFRCIPAELDGIVFTEVSDGNISDNTPFYVGYESINSLVEHLTERHAVLVFSILWGILTILLIVLFLYADNQWIE